MKNQLICIHLGALALLGGPFKDSHAKEYYSPLPTRSKTRATAGDGGLEIQSSVTQFNSQRQAVLVTAWLSNISTNLLTYACRSFVPAFQLTLTDQNGNPASFTKVGKETFTSVRANSAIVRLEAGSSKFYTFDLRRFFNIHSGKYTLTFWTATSAVKEGIFTDNLTFEVK